jgi:hypothetical protein
MNLQALSKIAFFFVRRRCGADALTLPQRVLYSKNIVKLKQFNADQQAVKS